MKLFKHTIITIALLFSVNAYSQNNTPEIYSWKLNLTGLTGYNGISANVQQVRYSANYVYVNCTDIPDYSIGPWPNNPNVASNQNFVFKIKRNPIQNTGTQTATALGHIGVFVNGVSIYNSKDAFSYNNLGIWNQNAVIVEASSFDACYGHPAQSGEYHNHQNPHCLYDAVPSEHSPLLGFAFDGFPVYGPYSYANTDGNGGIVRMKSSYRKRNISVRQTLPDGIVLSSSEYGPNVNGQYPLGYYIEDYEYVSNLGHLDAHNGRFAVTPEYPNGTYAYYTTLDSLGATEYPYIIGPKYYGILETVNVGPGSGHATISETVTNYTGQFLIIATAETGGTISPTGNVTVNFNESKTFTISANVGYHIDSVFVDGNYIGNNSTYTFENIISNHTIHATFSIDKFNLTTNATNGSITKVPDLPIYNYGTEVTLTANPNLGYHFVNWSGDLSTAINPVSIVINGNKNVTANFSIDQFTITSTSGENGTIVPNVNTTVNYGDDLSITILANVGYHIDSVFVDGNYIGNDSTYTFENIISNHTIHATFQFIDTTKYRTFLSSQYGGKSPSLKRKKGIVQNLSQPSNIRDLVIIKESGITIGKSVTKDSAKFYGWIYFKDGKSMTSFFPGIGTKSYPFDSIRTEKKPKIFVKQLSNPKAKTILNHLATEIAAFHINNLASKTTPKILSDDVLENLIYKDTSDEFGFSGLSLSQILDSANLYLTYYKKIPLETRENYFNTLDSIFTRVNREFYIGEITSNDTSHLPFRIFGGKKITEAIYFERTNSKVFSNNISIEKFSPTKFSLQQNFPNPFNPNTTISFSLVDVENNVSLKIYDILGRKVSTLLDNENLESGFYEIDFDANNLNSGIYFYKLTTNNFSEMKKMILIK